MNGKADLSTVNCPASASDNVKPKVEPYFKMVDGKAIATERCGEELLQSSDPWKLWITLGDNLFARASQHI